MAQVNGPDTTTHSEERLHDPSIPCGIHPQPGAPPPARGPAPQSRPGRRRHPRARAAVYFSPNGGATDAVVREITAAQHQILMQAYTFTSAPIAKALLEAHKRGVQILAVLDKSNETDKYSAATFLVNAGIQTLIDSATIITGSFNFTKA